MNRRKESLVNMTWHAFRSWDGFGVIIIIVEFSLFGTFLALKRALIWQPRAGCPGWSFLFGEIAEKYVKMWVSV